MKANKIYSHLEKEAIKRGIKLQYYSTRDELQKAIAKHDNDLNDERLKKFRFNGDVLIQSINILADTNEYYGSVSEFIKLIKKLIDKTMVDNKIIKTLTDMDEMKAFLKANHNMYQRISTELPVFKYFSKMLKEPSADKKVLERIYDLLKRLKSKVSITIENIDKKVKSLKEIEV